MATKKKRIEKYKPSEQNHTHTHTPITLKTNVTTKNKRIIALVKQPRENHIHTYIQLRKELYKNNKEKGYRYHNLLYNENNENANNMATIFKINKTHSDSLTCKLKSRVLRKANSYRTNE